MIEHTNSYYAATANKIIQRPGLKGEHRADVCVIGGGFTGVSAALNLAERGYKVILLEANKVGWGASGRNGGQASGEPRHDQEDLESRIGKDDARAQWDLNWAAMDEMKRRIEKHNIECDWTPGIIHATYKKKDDEWYKSYIEKLNNDYNCDWIKYVSPEEMSDKVGAKVFQGGQLDTRSGHVHPLNYVCGLAAAAEEAGAQIFEGSRVISYDKGEPTRIETAEGVVVADYVVLGCNGYLEKLEGRVAGKILPINNFVLVTEQLGHDYARSLIRDNEAVVDSKFVVNYWRLTPDNRLCFGGGENYGSKFPKDIANFVRKPMLSIYPQLKDVKIDYAWGGTLAITMNRMPHFGQLSPNVFYAQGYSGHGVVLASYAGKMIADALAGQAEEFDVLKRAPTYTFPGGTLLRYPGMVAGMLWYAMLDRL